MADTDTPRFPRWSVLGLMLLGMAFVLLAVLLAQRWELAPKLSLDFRGERGQGTAERTETGYSLRFTTSTNIYRRTYRGDLGIQRETGETTPIALVFDPEDPSRFQPMTVSYRPGVVVAALFLLGMGCVLYARVLVQRVQRAQRGVMRAKSVTKKPS
ncbi:MAG: hypothetical protein IT364_01380 [Candidatus Hydrogenedentes bacterium]|nr:hypothetical protein [Candidatus Hydrogenedentota bacterium]